MSPVWLLYDTNGASLVDLPRGGRRRSSRSATIGGVLHNRVDHCEPSILEVAARLKRAEGYRLPIAGSAQPQSRKQAVLIHKDPEFAKFPEIAQEALAK